jgi:flavin-dependent dehydrogenase
MAGLGPLNDGGHVAIIGGGPGGVGCALALHRMASEAGRHLQITLFEGKQFQGARHHNLCVGVVSPPLPSLMEQYLGVPCPEHLREGVITGYVLHTRHEQILLEDARHPSYALRRVRFDAYMLDMARQRGIRIVPARVVAVEFHADRVIIYSEADSVEADVVVGAFGMDEGAAALFSRAVGYHPPKALYSVLTRYHPGPAGLARFGPRVHAFLGRPDGIEFGAITPKGDHLTVNIAGLRVGADTMHRFLADPEVKALLPPADGEQAGDPSDFRVFKGRFPRSLARNYYGDRYVMVGDAAGLVRAFKGKGVTSAVQTGIRAAETILQVGISHYAFATHYEALNQDITGDLGFGRAVRLMVLLAARFGLLDPVVRAARHEPGVREALYGAVSAHQPYRQVLYRILNPHALAAVLRAMI